MNVNWRVCTGVLVFAATQWCFSQSDLVKDFVATNKAAYLMLPPDLICGPKVSLMLWSQDGQRLAVLRQYQKVTATEIADSYPTGVLRPVDDEAESQVFAWNAKSEKTSILYRLKASEGSIQDLNWVAGSSSLVLEAAILTPTGIACNQVLLLSSSGQVKLVASPKGEEMTQVVPSPTKPTVAFVSYPPPVKNRDTAATLKPSTPTVRFFGVDGVLSAPIAFPARNCNLRWSINGQPYVVKTTYDKGAPSPIRKWYFVNRSSMLTTPVDPPADLIRSGQGETRSSAHDELEVSDMTPRLAVNKVGVDTPVVTISPFGTPEAFGIVTSDGNRGLLAPNLTAVGYVSQENAMVRTLAKVPLEAYKHAKDAAMKVKLLNQAKQVALAMIMYSSDNDDNYVSNKGDWKSIISPYLKMDSMFDGFNYVFPGGNAGKIENPASTVLGYYEGPGGRAVAYTDGHAKWIPNP